MTHLSPLCASCCTAIVLFAVTPVFAPSQQPTAPQPPPPDLYTFQLNVDMVLLSATVVDRHNALVSGLAIQDFALREDGVLQQVKNFSHEDIPVTVGILVDNSSSMGSKRADVITAALSFARSSNPQDQIFVVNFNDQVTFALPPDTPFTDSPDILLQALSSIRSVGQTSLYDSIAAALEHLQRGTSDKKVLILITDGGDTASQHTLAQVTAMARQSSATIYAIGIFDPDDPDQNPDVLKRFARITGGQAFFPDSSSDIPAICQAIAHDIRNQYTLAYNPSSPPEPGRYHSISVTAAAPGRGRLSVRTRAGYTVPSNPPPASPARP